MSIINRVSNILRSRLDDLVARAESPEMALDRHLAELDQAVAELRARLQSSQTRQATLKKGIDRNRKTAKVWQEQAESAVARKDDDAARQALRRRQDLEAETKATRAELRSSQEEEAQLRGDLEQLQTRLHEATVRKQVLVAKIRAAEARKETQDIVDACNARVDAIAEDSLETAFDRLEHRLAELDALGDFDPAASATAGDDPVEAELAALKAARPTRKRTPRKRK
jgi:phage shock protein A